MLFSSLPGQKIEPSALAVVRPSFFELNRASYGVIASFVLLGLLFADRVFAAGFFADTIPIILATILNVLVGFLGQLLLVFVKVLVNVAEYNSFVTSAPVANGWTITRDIANMFFIVVLLMLAFGTIVGYQPYKYSTNGQLVRLLLMAIVVNFSRTICGLLIDISQVIMLSFVYGFRDAAGGNFADALRITQVMQARNDIPDATQAATGAWHIAVAMLLAFFMVLISLAVIITMTISLVIRIVYLWLLIVISPLAFLLKAVPGDRAKTSYGEWWKKFTSNLITGPFMAFFLWLALVSVAGNNLTTGFPQTTSKEEINGPISQAFQGTEIQSFVIAICLLLAGQKLARDIGGETLKLAEKEAGKITGAARRTVGAVARGTASGAGAVAGGVAGYAYTRTGAREGVRSSIDAGLARSANLPLIGQAASKKLSERRKERAALGVKGSEYLANLTIEERNKIGASTADKKKLSPQQLALRKEALRANLKDPEYAKKITKSEYHKQRKELETLGMDVGDKTVTADLKAFEKQRPDLIINPDDAKDEEKAKEQKKRLQKEARGINPTIAEAMDAKVFTPEVLGQMTAANLVGSRGIIRDKVESLDEGQTEEEKKKKNDALVFLNDLDLLAKDDISNGKNISSVLRAEVEKLKGTLSGSSTAVSGGQTGTPTATAPTTKIAQTPVEILAAGGTIQEAIKGYAGAAGFADKAAQNEFNVYVSNQANAKALAANLPTSDLSENDGINPLTIQIAPQMGPNDIVELANTNPDNADVLSKAIKAMETASESEFKGLTSAEVTELKEKIKPALDVLKPTGGGGRSFKRQRRNRGRNRGK